MGIFGSKKYIQGMIDGAKPFKDILEEVKNGKADLEELSKILSKRKYKKLLEVYFSYHLVKVIIVHGDKNEQISNDLRKLLSQRRFDVLVSSYEDYQIMGRKGAHYVIFIGDPENITGGKTEEVYSDTFGCRILKKNDIIFIMQNENVHITNPEDFLNYYKKIFASKFENKEPIQLLKEKLLTGKNQKEIKYIKYIDIMLKSADKKFLVLAQKHILLTKAIEIMETERQITYKGKV